MREVTVKRDELLQKLHKNKEGHRTLFEEAQRGFRERVVQELDRRMEDARRGRKVDLYINLPEPEDHTKDYDRVISMVEMSVSDEVELTANDFSRYVMDDWEWKERAMTTNSMYTGH